jgi:AraC family ethanolamine operon transcriptional activator
MQNSKKNNRHSGLLIWVKRPAAQGSKLFHLKFQQIGALVRVASRCKMGSESFPEIWRYGSGMSTGGVSRLAPCDVSDLAAMVKPWALEMTQLSAGEFSGELRLANAGGVLISRESWSHKVLAVGTTPADYFMVGIAGRGHGVFWRGVAASDCDLVWGRGGIETEFLVKDGGVHFAMLFPVTMMERAVGGDLADVLPGPAGVAHLSRADAYRLRQLVACAMVSTGDGSAGDLPGDMAGLLCGEVLLSLEAGNPGRDPVRARKAHQTCTRAVRLAEESQAVPTVTELAVGARVSLRVLELAFRETLGLSPHQFLTRLRLNRLHTELQMRGPDEFTVTAAMRTHGFTELGRTAQRYREIFQEKPSDTLARPLSKPRATFADVLQS